MSIRSWLVQIGLLLALSALTGCRSVTTVENVQRHPHRNWFTETVYLEGTIGQLAPLLDGQLYELKDGTGSIWVLSRTPNLRPGDQVLIKGRVRYQTIEIGNQDRSEVYIEEQHRQAP